MGGDVFVPSALIASAGNNANEYLAKHVAELGYLRPTIVASGGEARQVRLESDADLVQVVTIHKSKGLEYPLVFLQIGRAHV